MRRLPLADRIRVRSPCTVLGGWEAMPRTARGRFCEACSREVHDLSLLGREEVEALLASAESGLCIRVRRRRSDGAVLLADGHVLPGRPEAPRRLVGARATVTAATLSATAFLACASPSPDPVVDVVASTKAIAKAGAASGLGARETAPVRLTPAAAPPPGPSIKASTTHGATSAGSTHPAASPPPDYDELGGGWR
jgi:hypothetical protein